MHGAHSQRPLNPQTLERISGLLEDGGSVSLTEKGEATPVPRHAEFRLFAAMNPPTDFGKKELPPSIRTRFTEVHVVAPSTPEDLALLIHHHLGPALASPPVKEIVSFYLAATAEAEATLLDGADQRPQYSLRTLCRALAYVAHALGVGYGLHRALYDGFTMTFVTQLQQRFQPVVEKLILTHLMPPPRAGGPPPRPPPPSAPPRPPGDGWVDFGGFWVLADPRGTPTEDPNYIVTPSIGERLRGVARMVRHNSNNSEDSEGSNNSTCSGGNAGHSSSDAVSAPSVAGECAAPPDIAAGADLSWEDISGRAGGARDSRPDCDLRSDDDLITKRMRTDRNGMAARAYLNYHHHSSLARRATG